MATHVEFVRMYYSFTEVEFDLWSRESSDACRNDLEKLLHDELSAFDFEEDSLCRSAFEFSVPVMEDESVTEVTSIATRVVNKRVMSALKAMLIQRKAHAQ